MVLCLKLHFKCVKCIYKSDILKNNSSITYIVRSIVFWSYKKFIKVWIRWYSFQFTSKVIFKIFAVAATRPHLLLLHSWNNTKEILIRRRINKKIKEKRYGSSNKFPVVVTHPDFIYYVITSIFQRKLK